MNSNYNAEHDAEFATHASGLQVSKRLANACARDRGVDVILANHRCSRNAPPHTPDDASSPDEVPCNKWELFALLSFVVLSFAALFFCFYVISAKCRGTWPF